MVMFWVLYELYIFSLESMKQKFIFPQAETKLLALLLKGEKHLTNKRS